MERGFMAKRIFVVDDKECIADTLVAILRNSGYEPIAFYDARSALASPRQNHWRRALYIRRSPVQVVGHEEPFDCHRRRVASVCDW
jgi:DNA-binding NtrC family response regulator